MFNLRIDRYLVASLAISLGALACVVPGTSRAPGLSRGASPATCDSAAISDTTVYDTTQVTQRPRLRAAPKLSYPADAKRQGVHGRVIVAAVANADGTVDSASVVVIHGVAPSLDSEARRWVTGLTLWPACRGGHAVRVRLAVPVEFALGQTISPSDAFWTAFTIGMVSWLVRDIR